MSTRVYDFTDPGSKYTVSIRNDLLLSNFSTGGFNVIHTWMVVTNTDTGKQESYSLSSSDIGLDSVY